MDLKQPVWDLPLPRALLSLAWCLPTGVPAVPRVPPTHHQDPGAEPTFSDTAEGQSTGKGVCHLWDHGVPTQWRRNHYLRHRCGECLGVWALRVHRLHQIFTVPTIVTVRLAMRPADLIQIQSLALLVVWPQASHSLSLGLIFLSTTWVRQQSIIKMLRAVPDIS